MRYGSDPVGGRFGLYTEGGIEGGIEDGGLYGVLDLELSDGVLVRGIS